jgi:glycosyltransferase involved in cell wall biosynthesis
MTRYVIITPARNEAATIESTIRSVVEQTILPLEWIIVSNGCCDGTDDVVERWAREHPFMRLLHLPEHRERDFVAVVRATEYGYESLQHRNCDFIGLLDADVRFARDYFEKLIGRFQVNPRLGLAGGIVVDVVGGKRLASRQYLNDVAGAAQFYRRECFDSLGGLVPIPEGGWDALTCVQARAQGYETRTFPDLVMEHLKRRNAADGNAVRRSWQVGIRDYARGNHPAFELLRCATRCFENPVLIGSLTRWAAFCWCCATRRPRTLSPALVSLVRREQVKRMTRRRLLGAGLGSR